MGELILMRHAQATPAATDGDDFSRPLTTQGRLDATAAAQRLSAARVPIRRIILSPARRTVETAALVAAVFKLDDTQQHEVSELYLATPAALRVAAQRFVSEHHLKSESSEASFGVVRPGALLIIGHNPGLSEFGGELERNLRDQHLPTAGFWRVPFDVR